MVKYGKEFRKNQKLEWKEKYFDYKGKKQKINELLKEKEGSDENDYSIVSKLNNWSEEFAKSLDKDIKKVYIFFSNKERTLYKEINSSLHLKRDDERWDLYGYINVFKQLKEISKISKNITNYK